MRGLVSLKEGWYFYIRGLCTWTHEGKNIFRNCSLYRGAVSHQGSLPSRAHSAVINHQTTNQRACKTSKNEAEKKEKKRRRRRRKETGYHEKSLSTSKHQKWQEWEDLNINRSTERKTTMQFLIPLKPLNGGSNCVHIYIQIK